jgi:iron(III) transport system substrate-binding protein
VSSRSFSRRAVLGLVPAGAATAFLAACGSGTNTGPAGNETPSGSRPSGSITVYSGREEALVGPVIKQFEQATGIRANVKYGSTAALAATIQEEGDRSPADVFYAQDPGGLGAIAPRFGTLPQAILSKVPAGQRSPEGAWVGISGRARVVAYNTNRLNEADLPQAIMDFTKPEWRNRIGWAPTNGSLQAHITAMRAYKGDDFARAWLEGIKANGARAYANNRAILSAVASEEVQVGFTNHYYLYGFLSTDPNYPVRNYHTKNGDIGAVVLISGAGVLRTSKNPSAAQTFIEHLLSSAAQQYFALQTFEYPLVEGIITHSLLTPMDQIRPPQVDMTRLSDLEGSLRLMRSVGVIS